MSTTRREFMQRSAVVVGSLLVTPGLPQDGVPDALPPALAAAPTGPARVVAYVDGLSLYYGLKDRGWRRFYWLDAQALAQNLLRPGQQLAATKYFTARVTAPGAAPQAALIEALSSLGGLRVFYGKYHANQHLLRAGTSRPAAASEKSGDVNLAVQLLSDAVQDTFDVALIISADSDLVPAVNACRELFPQKRIVVAFPPRRVSEDLKQAAHAYVYIGRDKLARSLLAPEVPRLDGFLLKRPRNWE